MFKNEQKLKWTYRKPDYKVFLLEGDDYRFYDQDNEQLTIGKIKDRSRQWIWQLLFSDDIFRSSSLEDDKGQKVIHVKNKKDSLDVRITVDENFLPVKIFQIDPSGARMIFYFKNYRANVTVPDNAFQLNVPKGVDIIHADDIEK